MLVTVIESIRGFVDIYERLSSFPEIFLPIAMLLHEVAQVDNMPSALQEKFEDVALIINKKVDEHNMLRQPLQMRKKKPVPIKLLNPKFEEKYSTFPHSLHLFLNTLKLIMLDFASYIGLEFYSSNIFMVMQLC